jgi:uncharacterized membrane protein YfcA
LEAMGSGAPSVIAGLLVGLVVGVTGVGGGSLMAPILILIFGVAPLAAVGTDLWFAAITKAIGAGVHHKTGGPDYLIVRRLAYGSLPGAVVTLWLLSVLSIPQIKSGLIMNALGIVLILTALMTLFRRKLQTYVFAADRPLNASVKRFQTELTVVAGFILGVLVTLTSIGAGALGATMLIMLYPKRLKMRGVIATDIVHAVPLTALAGIGHMWAGNVNFSLLGWLLLGSLPGIVIGSLFASRVSESFIRPALAAVLMFAGYRLLL